MKTTLAAAALLIACASAGSAADMAVKTPYVAQPPVFSWSGFYLGVNAGYSWGSNNWTSNGVVEDTLGTLTVTSLKPKTNGPLGGVQAGANYQIASWVVGMEFDLAYLGRKGSSDGLIFQTGAPNTITTTATSTVDWLTQFTGRAGYALDRTLFYVKGGVAAGETKDNFSLTSTQGQSLFIDLGTKTNTMVGWTAGGGIEHSFSPNWSVKVEYNYVDLGSTSEKFNVLVSNTNSLTFRETIDHKLQIVKVGGNYKF